MVCATVLVPTHEHAWTLPYAVGSALSQTVADLEVFIVGDGPTEETRAAARKLAAADGRVRFFDNPKGPRLGEVLRHAALQEARGEIVCYLADDDLWLPHHVAEMLRLLRDADFAHTLPVGVRPDGTLMTWQADLRLPYFREMLLSGVNQVPLSCAAHTLAAYRRLPHGWRTTPEGTATDLYMWQQFLAQPWCRAASGTRLTAVVFPSPDRLEWTPRQREEEIRAWMERLATPEGRAELTASLVTHLTDLRVERAMGVYTLEQHLAAATQERDRLRAELAALEAAHATLAARAAALEEEASALREELAAIRRLPSWRLRQRVLRHPVGARLLRWVGRALAGPGAS
ncbi:MAG TPA: glycosyltransferase family 2 protein [Dehalococcoidia bacterium]